jgi:hypothetical protein
MGRKELYCNKDIKHQNKKDKTDQPSQPAACSLFFTGWKVGGGY